MGDRVSLGFIAATEEEVCKHLDRHLAELPEGDHRTREIIARMQADEAGHEQAALDEGGAPYPAALKKSWPFNPPHDEARRVGSRRQRTALDRLSPSLPQWAGDRSLAPESSSRPTQ